MTLFKFNNFSEVCRLCMSSDSYETMIPIGTADSVFEGSIYDFITAITFVISDEKAQMFPQMVCAECLELLKFFAKYRNKIMTLHLLMNSLVELKRSNPAPIVDLFESRKDMMRALFKDLDLCSKKDVLAQDLIDEFSSYVMTDVPVSIKEEDEVMVMEPYHTLLESENEVTKELIVEGKPIRYPDDIDVSAKENDKAVVESKTECNISPNPAKVVRKYGGKKLDDPLQCSKCQYKSYYKRNFETHQLNHLDRQYKCKEVGCAAVFDDRKAYRNHCDALHKAYVCEICGLRTASLARLRYHMERHTKDYKYVCRYCQKACKTKRDLQSHIVFHVNSAKYRCETCGLEFKRKRTLDDHLRTHLDFFEFSCNFCGMEFKKSGCLKRHLAEVHGNIKYSCKYCDKTYSARRKMLDHIEYVHEIQTHFLCEICVQSFYSQDDLDKHKIRHQNPKELECAICLDLFESDERLCDHLCITYRDDYICCDLDLRHHSRYNKHMFIKHGIKTNVRVKPDLSQLLGYIRAKRNRFVSCSKCGENFPTKKMKKQHMDKCGGVDDIAPLEKD
ncbi:zinc finger protein 26-like isoform X2 [Toxorhynchites rutilus septentrionalis]|nr:zinc finger protein 26-like isoform X2 [Toxorhynchites rutilus septentrionalis]